jgi:hypothetical protein
LAALLDSTQTKYLRAVSNSLTSRGLLYQTALLADDGNWWWQEKQH